MCRSVPSVSPAGPPGLRRGELRCLLIEVFPESRELVIYLFGSAQVGDGVRNRFVVFELEQWRRLFAVEFPDWAFLWNRRNRERRTFPKQRLLFATGCAEPVPSAPRVDFFAEGILFSIAHMESGSVPTAKTVEPERTNSGSAGPADDRQTPRAGSAAQADRRISQQGAPLHSERVAVEAATWQEC